MAQVEADGALVHHLHGLDGGEFAPVGGVQVLPQHPRDRKLHGAGVAGLAVVEAHPRPQAELQRRLVHHPPGFGQARHQLAVEVPLDQVVEQGDGEELFPPRLSHRKIVHLRVGLDELLDHPQAVGAVPEDGGRDAGPAQGTAEPVGGGLPQAEGAPGEIP